MNKTGIISILSCILPITALACSPLPGSQPLGAGELLEKAPYAFIATALETSMQLGKEQIRMKVNCVIKGSNFNVEQILNAPSVMVGPFSGSSLCSVDAQGGDKMMIFVNEVKTGNQTLEFMLKGDSSFPHSQTRPVPNSLLGNSLILLGDNCPAAQGGQDNCPPVTQVVTSTVQSVITSYLS